MTVRSPPIPVTFPSGRARFDTMPSSTGSKPEVNTMGIRSVARLAASAVVLPAVVTIRSTRDRASSAARDDSASTAPLAKRYSIVRFRPSTQPWSMSEDQLRAEIERLRAENQSLKSQRVSRATLKVSDKGGVSVYGLGRFPVTLYKEQWGKLLDMADDIRVFIKEHDAELKSREKSDS